jgi:hypothetical protein
MCVPCTITGQPSLLYTACQARNVSNAALQYRARLTNRYSVMVACAEVIE